MIKEGLSDVTAGRLVHIDEARRCADSIGTDSELPAPHSSNEIGDLRAG